MQDWKLAVDSVHGSGWLPLSRKLAGNFAKKMEGVERRSCNRSLVPVTPKSAKSSLPPGNLGESRGSQGKRNRSSYYTSPSLELKSRGRPYQPTKEDHSITFASFSPHSKASLEFDPSLSACLLASRLITRPPSPPSDLLPSFLSFDSGPSPSLFDNPIIRPFFSARKNLSFPSVQR